MEGVSRLTQRLDSLDIRRDPWTDDSQLEADRRPRARGGPSASATTNVHFEISDGGLMPRVRFAWNCICCWMNCTVSVDRPVAPSGPSAASATTQPTNLVAAELTLPALRNDMATAFKLAAEKHGNLLQGFANDLVYTFAATIALLLLANSLGFADSWVALLHHYVESAVHIVTLVYLVCRPLYTYVKTCIYWFRCRRDARKTADQARLEEIRAVLASAPCPLALMFGKHYKIKFGFLVMFGYIAVDMALHSRRELKQMAPFAYAYAIATAGLVFANRAFPVLLARLSHYRNGGSNSLLGLFWAR